MLVKASEILKDERILFVVTEEDLQAMAKQLIGRKLTEEELYSASKGVEEGLSYGLNTVLETAIKEAINSV